MNKNDLREHLADLCHRQWSGWMEYLFNEGTFNEDGTWTMPAWAVERWRRQAETDYADLSDAEKDSDRDQADKFLELLRNVLLDEQCSDAVAAKCVELTQSGGEGGAIGDFVQRILETKAGPA